MELTNKTNEAGDEEIQIDLLRLATALWKRAWIIAISAAVVGCIAFLYSSFVLTPLYEANALVYVNNSAVTGENVSITPNELSAAKSLVDTYIVILQAKNTLEELAASADIDRSSQELSEMITASAVNSTEIFKITATSPDPEEAALIINTLTQLLPDKISAVVDGSSVRIVDNSGVPEDKVFPSVTKYTLIGFLLGFFLACAGIITAELFDDIIHDEDYINQNYEVPILAIVPDLSEPTEEKYSYYGDYGKAGQAEAKNETDKAEKA